MYCFDVAANAFFPLFLQLYIAQLFLVPVVTRSAWVCLWLGNTLYFSAFTNYVYVTCEMRMVIFRLHGNMR